MLPATMEDGTLLAAIDLGSNSFRLEIGRYERGLIRRVEYLKETVRQGGGLDADKRLTPEAMQRGWDCLARFAERLAGFRGAQVRAVATQTLREARNRDEFLAKAHEVLGFPIDVIPGREEARLIYVGVSHLLPQSDERRLVVDIGGRSTELILGSGFEAKATESYSVGSVSWAQKYFAHGVLSQDAFERAEVAARAVLEESVEPYAQRGWDQVYGASGTIGAVADVLEAAGWPAAQVSRQGLQWLRARLLAAGHADRVRLDALKEDRRPVIGGGVAVLQAVFDLFDIDVMHEAQGALRHGVLYDLVEREYGATDLRTATVRRLADRFHVDTQHANRVEAVATGLFRQLRGSDPAADADRRTRKLSWAAQLHEIGTQISHGDAHKHGAYVIDNADAPGFAEWERHRLSLLVLGHRGKPRKLEAWLDDEVFVHQLLSLRLAVLLCHARREPDLSGVRVRASGRAVQLVVAPDWARRYPQSAHLLREEVLAWEKTAVKLELREHPVP